MTSFNVWVRYFVWNFKGAHWNSIQKILAIYWQCCGKCKTLGRPTDHPWLMVGWSMSALSGPSINIICWDYKIKYKMVQLDVTFCLDTGTKGHIISVHLWNCVSSFIPKFFFLQNLQNSLVAKRTIHGWTLACSLTSWVTFGNHISAALHWKMCSFRHHENHWSADHISIEFEIQPKFAVLWFKIYSTNHNEILHMSQQ